MMSTAETMVRLRAALHVHSTYSDGELSLREVRDVFVADGCQVVCMAEHADAFDPQRLRDFLGECRELSDRTIRFVPGLEFECADRMHIVGYGVRELADSKDAVAVIEHIARAGGVSVIAHPAPEHLGLIPEFQRLPDGIEVWNSKYDGSAAPRPAVFEVVRDLRRRKPDLLAFYGLDFHWKRQFRGLVSELQLGDGGESAVLDALMAGRFAGLCRDLRLPSDGVVPAALLAQFAIANARSRRRRGMVSHLKRWSGPLGRALPASVKSQLRRFL